MTPRGAPPATRAGGRVVVTPDVTAVAATIRFDVERREATATSTVEFRMDEPGCAAFDLRQPVEAAGLDGARLDPAAISPVDLGGGDGAEVRVLDVPLGGAHRLRLDHPLGTPAAAGAQPVGWTDAGVRFDVWMSDLEPGRYLEQWLPAPLCHDRFALELTVEVTGTDRPHTPVTNGEVTPLGAGRWRIRYPDRYTSLSPMLVLAPSDELVERQGRAGDLAVRVLRLAEVDADVDAALADTCSWLSYLGARYGRYVHDRSFTAVLWGPGRGMEYDGATTASVRALEHEVFHSWFGRGVKPASASDGWIDEAITSWATVSGRSPLPRFAELDPEEVLADPPTVLWPEHPWSRFTPRESYGTGARLWGAVATRLGGADRLRAALADWYGANAGGLVTTSGLLEHLERWSGASIGDLWDRVVLGRG